MSKYGTSKKTIYYYRFDLRTTKFSKEPLDCRAEEHYFGFKYSHTTYHKPNGQFIHDKNLNKFNRAHWYYTYYSLNADEDDVFKKMVIERLENLAKPKDVRYDYEKILKEVLEND